MRNLNSPKYLVESFPLNGHNFGIKSTATPTAQTWTSDRWDRSIAYFTAGGLTWSSLSFTSYEYMCDGTHYIFDGTNTYTNGVLTGSKPVTISATGFSGVTAAMGRIKLYNVVITPEEAAQLYKAAITQIPNSFEREQPYPTGPDLTDPALVGAWLNPETTGAKDASANGKDATVTNCRFNRDKSAVFANGNFTIASTSFDTYGYWYRATESGEWKLYISNNGTVYTNLVATGSMPVALGATGFSSQTCQLRDIRAYTGSLTIAQMAEWFNSGVPDSSLRLSVDGRGKDLSRYKNVCTPYGGAKIGGRRLELVNSGSYLSFPQTNIIVTSGMTYEFWLRARGNTSDSKTYLTCGYSFSEKKGLLVYTPGVANKLAFRLGNGAEFATPTCASAVAPNCWEYYALVYNGSTMIIYRNGVPEADTKNLLSPVLYTTAVFQIGSIETDADFDRVKVTSRAKTAAEILRNYNNEKKYY